MANNSGFLVFFVTVFIILIFTCTGWFIYTHIRARSLGLPPPALSSYNPFNHNDKLRKFNATRDGVFDWVKGKFNLFKHRDNHSTTQGFAGSRGINSRNRTKNHAFSPLDPDEAWDTRVGTEADGYSPMGYYERQEYGLHQTTKTPPRYEQDRERSRNEQSDSHIGSSQAGLKMMYDEETGKAENPFVDASELTILSPKDTNPRQGMASHEQGYSRNDNVDTSSHRRSLFKENM